MSKGNKKSGKKEGKSSNKGSARNSDSIPAANEPEQKQSYTEEQMSNPLFRAAIAFRNNPDSMRGMLGTPEPEEPKKEGPNFMQRLIARSANDANALCILGNEL